MNEPFFTIGHSNRTVKEFIALVREAGIELIVDVRRLPGSNRYPHFNAARLDASLHDSGVAFLRAEGLGGRRRVSRTVDFDVNEWWQNRSFHNYADYALSQEFTDALAALRDWGRSRRAAVMCSEAVWWRCHRRIIADHLLAHGEQVQHVLGPGQITAAALSEGAVVTTDAVVTYPKNGT